jgi:hypothetical protein
MCTNRSVRLAGYPKLLYLFFFFLISAAYGMKGSSWSTVALEGRMPLLLQFLPAKGSTVRVVTDVVPQRSSLE